MSCWVYPININGMETQFMTMYQQGHAGRTLLFTSQNSNKARMWIGGVHAESDADLPLNVWTHVVGKRDDQGIISIYINGVKQKITANNSNRTPLTDISIGFDKSDLSYTTLYQGEHFKVDDAMLDRKRVV